MKWEQCKDGGLPDSFISAQMDWHRYGNRGNTNTVHRIDEIEGKTMVLLNGRQDCEVRTMDINLMA